LKSFSPWPMRWQQLTRNVFLWGIENSRSSNLQIRCACKSWLVKIHMDRNSLLPNIVVWYGSSTYSYSDYWFFPFNLWLLEFYTHFQYLKRFQIKLLIFILYYKSMFKPGAVCKAKIFNFILLSLWTCDKINYLNNRQYHQIWFASIENILLQFYWSKLLHKLLASHRQCQGQ